MESQELKEFSFCIISRKTNDKIKKKIQIPYFWTPFTQICVKVNFPQKSGSVTF